MNGADLLDDMAERFNIYRLSMDVMMAATKIRLMIFMYCRGWLDSS